MGNLIFCALGFLLGRIFPHLLAACAVKESWEVMRASGHSLRKHDPTKAWICKTLGQMIPQLTISSVLSLHYAETPKTPELNVPNQLIHLMNYL